MKRPLNPVFYFYFEGTFSHEIYHLTFLSIENANNYF